MAEISATGRPSILVPGRFGSAGHQTSNARFFVMHGAAVVVTEPEIQHVGAVIEDLLFDEARLSEMSDAATQISKPDAARAIAKAIMGIDE